MGQDNEDATITLSKGAISLILALLGGTSLVSLYSAVGDGPRSADPELKQSITKLTATVTELASTNPRPNPWTSLQARAQQKQNERRMIRIETKLESVDDKRRAHETESERWKQRIVETERKLAKPSRAHDQIASLMRRIGRLEAHDERMNGMGGTR